ncbi:MAG: methionyl-tRNA formyltransferase [Xanthomonadales bacterium]|nr:methionyl-tRNA formyltransferase [Gammaproteobacteria bacterium]MBT8052869.1 methionyl-tRNA formyltransferase [Gammaproteobacteria bacterium]NND55670.1 methionyl-tRNA formyltransferase [Xanthomonadales bacterium]NNK49981.1 methionyl-tRNA formyltransferase [Xanthomonadales bacterium]
MRILFAGTPEFAVDPLQRLITEGVPPVAVLTQPDRPAGRGRQLAASPVKQAALAAGLKVFQPATLKDPASVDLISGLRPDLMIVVAYGLILPSAILSLPRFGCWNIHASLLPRWRGAAPIQRAIEAGDPKTGVCIMQMDEGLDTGPVILCKSLYLHSSETGGSLHDRLSLLGAEALLECVHKLRRGEQLGARPQAGGPVSYARKLEKSEAQIDWSEPAQVLERRIRAFNPWPVAWFMAGVERIRVWRAALVSEDHDAAPGTVLRTGKHGIDVATGAQALRLQELQRPGKRRMSAAEYLNACSMPERFELKT